MSNSTTNISIVNHKQGQSLSVVGDTYRILISGKQTNGNYAIIDMLVPPGGGPGPHAHANMQETFYVVDGEVEFKTETGNHIATTGTLVNIPLGGAVHSFKNTSQRFAHLLCTVMPSGLEELFEEIGKPVAAGIFLPPRIPDVEEQQKLKIIAEKYGQKVYPPDFLDRSNLEPKT